MKKKGKDLILKTRKSESLKSFVKTFAIDKFDIFLFLFNAALTITIWIMTIKRFSLSLIFTYNEIPITAFEVANGIKEYGDVFNQFYKIPFKDFKYPLNGYYFYLKIVYFLCLGHLKTALFISVLIINFLLVYLFRRLLLVYNFAKNPILSTCMFCILPTKVPMFYSLPTFDGLFFCLICFNLIVYKLNFHSLSLISCILICTIKFEGLSLPIALLLSSAFSLDLKHGVLYFLVFLFDYYVFYAPYQYSKFFMPGQNPNENFLDYPFSKFFYLIGDISRLMDSQALLVANIIVFIGSLNVLFISFPVGFVSLFFFVLMNSTNSNSPYRLLLPASSISVICGYDMLFSSKYFKCLSVFILPLYFFFLFFFIPNFISSSTPYENAWIIYNNK